MLKKEGGGGGGEGLINVYDENTKGKAILSISNDQKEK